MSKMMLIAYFGPQGDDGCEAPLDMDEECWIAFCTPPAGATAAPEPIDDKVGPVRDVDVDVCAIVWPFS